MGLIALSCAQAVPHDARFAAGDYLLRVDRTWERPASDRGLEDADYREHAARDAYAVTLEGDSVTLVALAGEKQTLHGKRTSSEEGEERFELDAFAGGYLLLRGGEAELTILGSGVPIVSSERGILIPR
jgi:hypothetical protein